MPIPGRPPSLIAPPPGCCFHPRCPYVREAHKKTDPPLEPTTGDGRHLVRCLLPPQNRRALWGELGRGATPEQARDRVGIPEAASVDEQAVPQ